MGKISKVILSRVNSEIRNTLQLCQWQSSDHTLEWFNTFIKQNTAGYKFIQMDIDNFYPSIGDELLRKALEWAKQHTYLSDIAVKIILHARRTILFDGKNVWCKKENTKFDISQGAFDACESSDLIGLYMLNQIVNVHNIIPREHFGLYRDDVLGIVKGGGPQIERTKKRIIQLFKQEGLKVTPEANTRVVKFLDFILNLDEGLHMPYHKQNANIVYVNRKSNHPPQVLENIPKGVEQRLSRLSSNDRCFNNEKHIFQKALNDAGYCHQLEKQSNHKIINISDPVSDAYVDLSSQENVNIQNVEFNSQHTRKKRQRKRNILWFNPPYNVYIENNVGRLFFNLIQKHFKKGTFLGKLFNKNTLKLSYSCCPKIKARISAHNRKLLTDICEIQEDKCNCQVKNNCPMQGEGPCNVGSVVYVAEVTSPFLDKPKNYVGSSNHFKKRLYRHRQSFRNINLKTDCQLSEFVWTCLNKGYMPNVKFKVIKKVQEYSPEMKKCLLCLCEKLEILKRIQDPNNINSRSELMAKCRHRNKFLLSNVDTNRYIVPEPDLINDNQQILNSSSQPEFVTQDMNIDIETLQSSQDHPITNEYQETKYTRKLRNGKILK